MGDRLWAPGMWGTSVEGTTEMETVCVIADPHRWPRKCRRIGLNVAFGAAILLFSLPTALRAEEPAERFLETLRQAGYYDAALLYLERLDGNPLISETFQSELDYQRGITQVEAAILVRELFA